MARSGDRATTVGEIDESVLQAQATALLGFARAAGVSTWRFRHRVLSRLPVSGQEARTG